MNTATETLGALLQRYAGDNDELRAVPSIRFDEALQRGDDPLRINDDDTEEEIHAFRVVEGVAVVMASDGSWRLFEPAATKAPVAPS